MSEAREIQIAINNPASPDFKLYDAMKSYLRCQPGLQQTAFLTRVVAIASELAIAEARADKPEMSSVYETRGFGD